MKQRPISKRLCSMLMALTMITSLTPAKGALMADETETDTPAVTESTKSTEATEAPASETPAKETPKETEKPSSDMPEETEEPAPVTPSETETTESTESTAPEETDKPAAEEPKETAKPAAEDSKETEAPAKNEPEETEKQDKSKAKVPDDSASQAPGNSYITVGKINATISNGVLTWEPYSNAVNYTFRITEGRTSMDYSPSQRRVDLKEWIDMDIEGGYLEKLDSYTIRLTAYDQNDYLIAEWIETFKYDSPATLQEEHGMIKNVKISNGILTWDPYPDTEIYFVSINGVSKAWYEGTLNFSQHRTIYDLIDEAIQEGEIIKQSPYRVRVIAWGYDGSDAVGELILPYDSKAERIQRVEQYDFENIDISDDSVLSWDEIPDAAFYCVYVSYDNGNNTIGCWTDDVVETRMDLYGAITEMVNDDSLIIPSYCKLSIELYAWDRDGNIVASGSTSYMYNALTSNPLSVKGKTAKVKYKNLRRKKQRLSVSKVISGIKTGQGKLTFTKVSGNKKISINKNTGKVTISKKGLKKKKTYKVTVKIRASGNDVYAPVERKVTFRIKVR